MTQNKRLHAPAAGLAAAIGLGLPGLLAVAVARQTPAPPPGPVNLVTGKALTPQGAQTEVGSFPVNLLLSPDGQFVVVSNTGSRTYLTALSARTGQVVSQLSYNGDRKDLPGKKETLYYGLAWGRPLPGGKTELFVSRGSEDTVAVVTLDGSGALEQTSRLMANPSGLPPDLLPHFVAGLAASKDGTRVYAANNTASPLDKMRGSLSILSAANGSRLSKVTLPGFPYGVAALTGGPNADRKVYVTSEQRGVLCVVDVRDPANPKLSREVKTGAQPTSLLLDRAQKRLFVSNGSSDTVSVVDTDSDRVTKTILVRPDDARGLPGATPLGMALSPDERTLYVALGDMNAVAVVDVAGAKVTGYIPVGWYPTAVAVSADGARLFVANAKGVAERNPNGKPKPGLTERTQYVQNVIEGTVSTVALAGLDLPKLTAQTLANNYLRRVARPDAYVNPGIEHVIYVIKENRTYDQVLGDLPRGNGDPSLCLFPREVTPNQHALAERFVLLDNFYCCAEVSGDGWNWSTAGMANEYVARNVPHGYGGRVRNYDYEGQNNGIPVDLGGIPDVSTPAGGYLWDLCAKNGVSLRNYGFFTVFKPDAEVPLPADVPQPVDNAASKKVLEKATALDFRKYDLNYPDGEAFLKHGLPPAPNQLAAHGRYGDKSRMTAWLREYGNYVNNGGMPKMMVVRLGRNHTSGTRPGAPSPRAMVAENDYALGQLVEAVSASPYWKKTAIFVVEDDAQNGYDHVDAHRSIAFVVSPFVRKNSLDSRFYNTDSVLRTMELLLGLPPMNVYDAIASPFAVFTEKPDNADAYQAILPAKEIIGEINQRTAYRAADSARLINPFVEESLPDEELNDILWHAIKGRHIPAPARVYGLQTRRPTEDDD